MLFLTDARYVSVSTSPYDTSTRPPTTAMNPVVGIVARRARTESIPAFDQPADAALGIESQLAPG